MVRCKHTLTRGTTKPQKTIIFLKNVSFVECQYNSLLHETTKVVN